MPRRARTPRATTSTATTGFAPAEPVVVDPATVNPAGAASDPFAYTRGSLLTPWEGRFSYTGGSGGYTPPAYQAFKYSDFSYTPRIPGDFGEVYKGRGDFNYADYRQESKFAAPTAADMEMDPGYKFRLEQGQKQLEASKAAQGVLRTGGTLKSIVDYGQGSASQEYGNVYNRRAAEYDRREGENRYVYGTNRSNAAENWDRNVSNDRAGYQVRQGAWKDNAAVALEGSKLGYDVAQGSWDRNYAKARQGYDDEQSARSAAASASASNASQAYGRALDEYTMARDEFWTNQDRQYNILDREATRGYQAARDYGMTRADLATGRGNARAAGRVGAANASADAWGAVANAAAEGAMYAAGRRPTTGRRQRLPPAYDQSISAAGAYGDR